MLLLRCELALREGRVACLLSSLTWLLTDAMHSAALQMEAAQSEREEATSKVHGVNLSVLLCIADAASTGGGRQVTGQLSVTTNILTEKASHVRPATGTQCVQYKAAAVNLEKAQSDLAAAHRKASGAALCSMH